jgi:hypothetical protein
MDDALRKLVRTRANNVCEYYRVPQSSFDFTFPIDHVISRQHGGPTTSENLALACLHCNRFKGPNIAGIDSTTNLVVRLFHPRKDLWHIHFEWSGGMIYGKTDVGRATVAVLAFNTSSRVSARAALMDEGVIPK